MERQRERVVAPRESVGRDFGHRVTKHREDVALGIPKCVPVVARARQSLGGDGPALTSSSRLEHVKQ